MVISAKRKRELDARVKKITNRRVSGGVRRVGKKLIRVGFRR